MNIQKTLVALTLLALGSTVASAEEASHPCKEIKSACESAGFVKGGHKDKGKGLWKDCIEKLMAGESVAGVSVTPDKVAACKAKKEKHQKMKQEKAESKK